MMGRGKLKDLQEVFLRVDIARISLRKAMLMPHVHVLAIRCPRRCRLSVRRTAPTASTYISSLIYIRRLYAKKILPTCNLVVY